MHDGPRVELREPGIAARAAVVLSLALPLAIFLPALAGAGGALVALIALATTSSVCCGGLGAALAEQKRREAAEGWLLGGLFGPLGLALEALLPAR